MVVLNEELSTANHHAAAPTKLATEHTAVDEAGSTKSKLQIRKLDEVAYAYHSPMHKLVWCENLRNRVTISPMSAHRIHMGHSY